MREKRLRDDFQVEKDVQCVGFCDTLEELPYNGDWTLEKVSDHMDGLRYAVAFVNELS